MATDRTSLRLTDERQRRIDRATELIASDEYDDPPTADVIDAALVHLLQSADNMDAAREELDPETIQRFNTDVLALHYRTSLDLRWR